MGQRDYFDKKPTLGETNNALVFLFAVNTFIFLILIFLKLVYSLEYRQDAEVLFNEKVLYWFALSPEVKQLAFKPWSILMYTFTNFSIIGFISNMLWLWAFGYILQDLIGNKKLIPVYLYGSFIGGMAYLIASIFLSSSNNYLFEGSSTAVIAIAVATTTLSPKYKIFQHIGNGFSLWILTLIYIVIDISFISFTNLSVLVAHITAALVGYLFILQLKKGNDLGNWMYSLINGIENLFNPTKKNHKRGSDSSTTPLLKNTTQEKVDEILDKINQSGYDSLNKLDKDFLEKYSK